MEKEGFIYIWYDRKHKRYYIGCHWGTVDDGYICSSTWLKQGYKYRPGDFRRRILKRGIPRKNLLEEEYKWLNLIKDEELGKKYYNLSKKYFGHWSVSENSNKTIRQKLSEASKKLHQNPEYKQKFIEGRKKLPPMSAEHIAKRTKSQTGLKRSEETKRKISMAHKGKKRGPLSPATKQKLSEALKGEKNPFFGKQHDPELKKKMNEKASKTMKERFMNKKMKV